VFANGRHFASRQAIMAFSGDRFGRYPFASDGVVVVDEESVLAYEPQTRAYFGRERLVAHEMAHQWFGDWVSQRSWHRVMICDQREARTRTAALNTVPDNAVYRTPERRSGFRLRWSAFSTGYVARP
jgi:hypothetical protein